jgi:hypothetical protein
MRSVTPSLDPLAYRAAIDALEAQRAAYRRYARTVEAQGTSLGDGDGDRATALADLTARGFDELETSARRLDPVLRQVTESGSATQIQEVQGQMAEMMREAREAETAIRNLTLQLEAWRDAYGRQLAELGFPPRPDAEAVEGQAPAGTSTSGRRRPYVQPGFGRGAGTTRPTLIDKTG